MLKKDLEELFQLYIDGNQKAFDELFPILSSKSYQFLRKRLRREEDVEEVQQRCFLKLHRTRHRYDKRYPLLQWLYVLLRSEMLDYLKSQKRHRFKVAEILKEEIIESQLSHKLPQVSLNSLEGYMETLEKEQQALLEMRVNDELSFAEIAPKLGIKHAGVRKRWSRLIQELKQKWGESHEN